MFNSHDTGHNRRATIGFLTASVHPANDELLWSGVHDAARKHDASVVTFAGGQVHGPDRFTAQANVLYDLVSGQHVDGLLIWSCTVGWYLSQEDLTTFFRHYHPLPCVSIDDVVEGFPCVLKDNYSGMRDAIIHLIEVHHYRRLAFLQGPDNILWAQERYRAYLETLAEYDVSHEPDLIVPLPKTEHFEGTNTKAAARQLTVLFDDRKLRPRKDIDAIVAATDHLAHEAIMALRARGIRVPEDVAVIGFDDEPVSRVTIPPLTTVRNPIYEMGWQAVEMLLALLRGDSVPEQVVLPTKAVIRQSCGCQAPSILQAEVDVPVSPFHPLSASGPDISWSTDDVTDVLRGMRKAIGHSGGHDARDQMPRVLESFLHELKQESPGRFLATLEDVLLQDGLYGGNIMVWQNVISELRCHLLPRLHQFALMMRAENLWGQARVLIGEIAQQIQARQAWQAEQQAQILREIESALITAFDNQHLLDVLRGGLPLLNIPGCYLCLYEHPDYPTEARLIVAYNEKSDIQITPAHHTFPSAHLLPEGILSPEHPFNVLAVPLYCQEQSIGFAVFTVGPPDGQLYETLRGQISSTLQGANLVHDIRERSAELTRKNYILNTFMANIPDSIYFKDCEGRITLANTAHAARLGLHDPIEEIGKTDFDFCPEPVARLKFEQEQAIIRSGQPLLNLEEPSITGGTWVLTTKMPLRDEHGNIIGTFGISHDITALKHTQTALEKAYAEVELRIAERTAELQREVAERVRAEAEIHHLQGYLQNIIDSMPAVLMSVDAQGNITQWNREAANMTGLTSDDVQGRPVSEVFTPLQPHMPRIWQAIRERTLQKDMRVPHSSASAMRYADITVYPLIANGTEGAVIIIEDVTERVRIEDSILHTEKMMTVGGLAAGMAHEINNPLNVILQGISNIQRRFSVELLNNKEVAKALGTQVETIRAYLEQRHIVQYFDLIQTSAWRAAQIVENMLMFSRHASSMMMPDNLNSILERTLDLATNDSDLKNMYNFHKITLVKTYDSKLPQVQCISTEIQQVLLNILRNAAQAMTDVHPDLSPPCIHLTTRQEAESVRMDIADNGPGMTEDIRKRVFEPFFTARAFGDGAGLGLSVAYFIIVTHHHGQFFVNSTPGAGATFTILLPIDKGLSSSRS